MRYAAAPIERLRSILSSLREVTDASDQCILRARAVKAQHLCLEIDKGACEGRITPPGDLHEALDVIDVALGFLSEPSIAARPPVALIYTVYVCAGAVASLAQRSAPGAA
jgi:hypothetical protein